MEIGGNTINRDSLPCTYARVRAKSFIHKLFRARQTTAWHSQVILGRKPAVRKVGHGDYNFFFLLNVDVYMGRGCSGGLEGSLMVLGVLLMRCRQAFLDNHGSSLGGKAKRAEGPFLE